jgi:hypothetical protein
VRRDEKTRTTVRHQAKPRTMVRRHEKTKGQEKKRRRHEDARAKLQVSQEQNSRWYEGTRV